MAHEDQQPQWLTDALTRIRGRRLAVLVDTDQKAEMFPGVRRGDTVIAYIPPMRVLSAQEMLDESKAMELVRAGRASL